LSENVKMRLDIPAGETQQERLARLPDQNAAGAAGQNHEAESAMRRALGLLGESPRRRVNADRPEQPGRSGGGFNGGLHRRRFVQDGDIPVTVLRRDQPVFDAPANRLVAPISVPTSSRLQRTEAALAAETAAREKAGRSLNETYALVHDLQTKIGHAELAKNEAVEALHREREQANQLRAEAAGWETRLQEAFEQARAAETAAHGYQDQLSNEREARRAAEKALRSVEAAREAAEELVRALSEQVAKPSLAIAPRGGRQQAEPVHVQPPRLRRPPAEPEVAVAATRRQRPAEVVEQEPEPVKWWLTTKPAPKRR
jgi:DNA repair exonuclease SbcCD ATPase subunit